MRVIKPGITNFTKEVTCPTCQAVLECTSQEMKYKKESDYRNSNSTWIDCSITCPECGSKVPITLEQNEEKVMDAIKQKETLTKPEHKDYTPKGIALPF